jgi:hypothetical protein
MSNAWRDAAGGGGVAGGGGTFIDVPLDEVLASSPLSKETRVVFMDISTKETKSGIESNRNQ